MNSILSVLGVFTVCIIRWSFAIRIFANSQLWKNFCQEKLFLPSITVVEAVGVAQAASGRAGESAKE